MDKIQRIPSWKIVEVINTKYGTMNIYLSDFMGSDIKHPWIYVQSKKSYEIDGKIYCISLRYGYKQHSKHVSVIAEDVYVTKDSRLDEVPKKESNKIVEYFDIIVAEWINNDFDCKYNNYMYVALNNDICNWQEQKEEIDKKFDKATKEISKYKYTPKEVKVK